MLSSERAVFTVKKSYGNSGIPEHAMSLVVPYFPRPPDFRGHYSEKCGTGPELLNDARRERVRPDIARLRRRKREEMWFGTRRYRQGDVLTEEPQG